MDSRGALSGDFVLSILITIIISLGLLSVISDRMDLTQETEKISQSRLLTEKIASSINNIQNHKGKEIIYKMPESIGNSSNYVVSVNSTGVYIDIDKIKGKSEIYPVVIVNELNSTIEVNMYPGKSYLIRNNPSNNHKKTISIIEVN
ncbi:MAG TPA: hypothetical protein VLR54_00920 [Methanobacteriaceae archaeon]|nr:hypothetical protein [Methanobacteriaceae archaeon]